MPDPTTCAGRTMPLSPRPHWLCRGGNGEKPCTRFAYGITGGIEPRFIADGQPTCADKVVHVNTVGDDPKVCAPTR